MIWKIIIFVVSFVAGIVHGVIIDPSFNIFFSWILVGIWLIITSSTIEKSRQHSEYNSPHNTAYFTTVPLFTGIFYSIWSNFTGLLGFNLVDNDILIINWWSFVFSFPYIMYGVISIHKMFKKYLSVYFGTRAVKSRGFGYFITFSVIVLIGGYWIFFYQYLDNYEILLNPLNYQVNAFLILALILVGIVLFASGFFGKRVSLPSVSQDYITNRTRSINETIAPQTRVSSPPVRISSVSTSSGRSSHRNTSTPRSSRSTPEPRPKQQKVKRSPKPTPQRTAKPVPETQYSKLKPKGVNLTIDDFRCIFCFEIPKLPDNHHGGIVICPECRYPAHFDEFKDWTSNSHLCSRCDAPLPLRYLRNPKVIPTSEYLKVIKMFSK